MAEQTGEWLVLLAKRPERGRSKTRLARDVGDEDAARLAKAFLLDTLALCAEHPARFLVAYAPTEGREWFAEHAPTAALTAQPEAEFDERVVHALRSAFERGASRCVILGMDTPQLELSTITSAFRALDDHDVCLGPSEDGGYYLLGLRELEPALFEDIAWSTSSVLSTTLERARERDLTVALLEPERDVDDVQDLAALRETLNRRPNVAIRTRSELDRLG